MRNIFYYKIFEYAHCPQQVQLLSTHSVSVVWAADDKMHNELVVFRRIEGRLELLIFSVYLLRELVCVNTHLAARQLEGWSYNELTQALVISKHEQSKMLFVLFLDVICLKFIDQKYLQLFLNCGTFVFFLTLPFHSPTKNYCHADLLALSCIEFPYFTEKKDRSMGLTKMESYSTHNLHRNTSSVTSLSKIGASN